MKSIILFLTILISAFNLLGQTIITGIVKEAGAELLPGANIYLDQTQIGTTSNVDGKFEITLV